VAPERAVRLACRDAFRTSGLLSKIIPGIEAVLSAGDLPKPDPHPEGVDAAIPEPKEDGDVGHRG
jgi:CRISPR-associated protein Cas1